MPAQFFNGLQDGDEVAEGFMDSHSSENTSANQKLGEEAGRARSTSAPHPSSESLPSGASLREDLGVLASEVGVLVQATWDRTRLRLRSTVRGLSVGIVAIVVATLFVTRAAFSVLDGLQGAFTQITGSPWCGDLFAGLLAVGGIVFGLWILGRREERIAANALRAKYDAPMVAPRSAAISTPVNNPTERSSS